MFILLWKQEERLGASLQNLLLIFFRDALCDLAVGVHAWITQTVTADSTNCWLNVMLALFRLRSRLTNGNSSQVSFDTIGSELQAVDAKDLL